jgi:very-short-patch-repair endonuclease
VKELQARLRSGGGAIKRKEHRDLSGHIDRMLRKAELVALLPGVYCAAGDVTNDFVRLRAACLWAGPDAVLTGYCAAKLTFWPGCRLERITLALPSQSKRSQPGFEVEFRRIPDWLTRQRHRATVTAPALTAVDLAGGVEGGNGIDRALLSGQASLAEMWDALRDQPHRRGNSERARLLLDSRDQPWSAAERLQHQLLRAAGISGWRANGWVPVPTPSGGYCVDVLFRREALVVEIDGWESHGTRAAFETDRRRRNELVLAGYRVLNFTWRQLVDEPDWVIGCIRRALSR